MAIGPTANPNLPISNGQRGPISPAFEPRRLEESESRRQSAGPEPVVAELLDPIDNRQADLERTAEQIRILNPNAPRGSILNILV